MHPVLLTVAGVPISSFSIFLLLGWAVFSFVFWKSLREEGVGEERIFDLTFYATIASFVGSRLGFVAFHWDQFAPSLLKIVALWVAPGMSLLPGVIAGCMAMVLLGRRWKVRIGAILDAWGLALPGALAVGSVGSFLDGTVIGRVSSVPWAIRYVGFPNLRHPYQLYETVVLFLVLTLVGWLATRARQKKWALGSVGVGFFLLWGLSLFGLEFFKENTLYWAGVSPNQWGALALGGAAVVAWYTACGGIFFVRSASRRIYERISKRRP